MAAKVEKRSTHWLERVRKHIAWRAIVGVMALVGGITTIASLKDDVIKPLLFPHRELRREIELVDLIRMFISDTDGEYTDWTTGATPDSPIEWVSKERYGDMPDSGFFARFSCARHGRTIVKIHGKPSHEQFEEFVRPAVWDVSLYGCMAGVECIQFSSYGSGYNKEPNIAEALTKYVKVEEAEALPCSNRILYHVSMPGKVGSWLVESWSKGNHVWSVELTLFSEMDAHSLAEELYRSLAYGNIEDCIIGNDPQGNNADPSRVESPENP